MLKTLLLFLIIPLKISYAEKLDYFVDQASSSIIIKGDSTVGGWKMRAQEISGVLSMDIPIDEVNVLSLQVRVKSDQILSDSSSMNEKAHKTLKVDKFPEIIFNIEDVRTIKESSPGPHKEITASGNLMIAGKTMLIEITGLINAKIDSVEIKGNHQLKMTDFDLRPPKLLFLKTENKVNVHYHLVLFRERNRAP